METERVGPPYEIVPGVGIGPFRLGMTAGEIERVCLQTGLRNAGMMESGLYVTFHDGRAVRVEMAADLPVSLAGERLNDTGDANVARLLAAICPPAPDWTEREGIVAFHWEFSDHFVCSFVVYAPGWRYAQGPVG